ncbi:F-box and WD repeat domain containing protein 10B-like isoform X2 [Littorina saxatilis]|uniref:F-box and WD repeat domain containing protein 10B-like isoform X2 n=1 Tax=Littorina saxatilis TaxID=31220 RepID=UPI0038B46173
MLEICNYPGSGSAVMEETMKHTTTNIEQYEFNLGRAPNLRCVNTGKSTVCGECETCLLTLKMKEVKEWFHRLGDNSRKKFMLGLLRRIHSVDLLRQLVTLLQPVVMKDFMYARARSQPSLTTDMMTLSADRALSEDDVLKYITSTWDWFAKSSYWSKANFAFSLLQACDAHLLYLLFTQANTLLVSEKKATEAVQATLDYMETASIASTEYSYRSEKHPELQLLTHARTDYSEFTTNPFTGAHLPISRAAISRGDTADSASTCGTDTDSVDPAILIIPTSSKAYSGVARYKDFIGSLPVHLAKCILSFLHQASLFNALCVNLKWRTLVEEVHQEHFVGQSLWEEVMLMQGAAAQGANPVYANDVDILVPELHPGTYEVLEAEDSVIKTTFKSEINFKTAYSGVVTRKVIMEERNVYCGAYNVMVLCDVEDGHRVIHTDGGGLIALGSRDRKVRFIDFESGKDHGPVITGHAGSIRCVHLCEEKGIVFSGSYDTSIRCWSIETGQCLKIFRGHTDTVMTVLVHDNVLASGAKDKSCKVWDMETGKCKRTFRHRHPVLAVALSSKICITGCEGGRVKVWELASGQLIKNLSGHHGPVTAIKFDRWHIVTGSRDGYALAWSALGRHNRCLTALRHPKEVLCLEFMHLRVITGSGDGRLRIWNMINGQCCRIMRGNSRSDPILNILAIGDRITLNTHNNLLVLNFEHVDWDYSLETDKVPPLVQYGSYSDAPVRSQPYSYVRAQRMRKAGASNAKLLHRPVSPQRPPGTEVKLQHGYHAPQLPHSARSLSEKRLDTARRVQSAARSESPLLHSREGWDESHYGGSFRDLSPTASMARKPPPAPSISSQRGSKPRPATSKSGPTVTIVEKKEEDDDSEILTKEPPVVKRRVSWAFDKPLEPRDKTISLSEMKALLRSQIRMRAESVVPPDFIYLTVSTIQSTMVQTETNRNTARNMREAKVAAYTQRTRPSSSPSRIDPRTKVPVEELGLEVFIDEDGTISEVSDLKSIRSMKVKEPPKPPRIPSKEVYSTQCAPTPVAGAPRRSLHPGRVKTTIPRGRVIRPISAGIMQEQPADIEFFSATSAAKPPRPVTAPVPKSRPFSCRSGVSTPFQVTLPGVSPTRTRAQPMTTAAVEVSNVPMLMYSKDIKDKIEEIKQQRKAREQPIISIAGERPLGKVSPHNTPMRTHVKFELKTHAQEREHLNHIEEIHQKQRKQEQEQLERKKRAAWLAKAKGIVPPPEAEQKPSTAPELREKVKSSCLSITKEW